MPKTDVEEITTMALKDVAPEDFSKMLEEYRFTKHKSMLGELSPKFDTEERVKDCDIFLEESDFALSPNAEEQIVKMLKIPYGYWAKLPIALRKELFELAYRENKISDEEVVLKEKNGVIHAILPIKNIGIDNETVIDKLQDLKIWKHFNNFQMSIGLYNFDLRATWGKKGDVEVGTIMPGIHISNSECGNRKASVVPIIYRLVCSNGMVVPQRTLSDGFKLSPFNDLTSFNKKFPESVLRSIQFAKDRTEKFVSLSGVKLEDPKEIIRICCSEHGFNKEFEDAVINSLYSENEERYRDTVFGVVNAFTAAARSIIDPTKRLRVESAAGAIANKRWIN